MVSFLCDTYICILMIILNIKELPCQEIIRIMHVYIKLYLQLPYNSYQPCVKQHQTTQVLLLSIKFLIHYMIQQRPSFLTSLTFCSVETAVMDKIKYKAFLNISDFSLHLFCPFLNKDEKFICKIGIMLSNIVLLAYD